MAWTLRKIPVIGDELAKIGKIYDMAMLPCQPTMEAWVLAFWYGIPRLLWALYKPDPLDDVWERVGRTRGIKRRQKFKFVEEYTQDIDLKPSLRWVRFAGDWAQRVGWWMLIVDAGVNEAMYWQSAAMAFDGCKTPGNPYAQGSGNVGVDNTDVFWKRISLAVNHSHIFTGGIGEVIVPAGYGYFAGFEIASQGDQSLPPGARAKVTGYRIKANNVVIAQGTTDQSIDGTKTSGAIMYRRPVITLTQTSLIFEFTCGGPGFCDITSATISVTGAGVPLGLRQGDP